MLKRKNVDNFDPYCSDFYKAATLVKAYEILIISMPGRKDWHVPEFVDGEVVLQPKSRKSSEWSKKERHK